MRPLASEQRAPTALYRFYSADRRLLYVGITGNPQGRFAAHEQAEWAPMADLRRTRVRWYQTRHAALAAEVRAIRRERPIYNQQGAAGLDRQPVQLAIRWPQFYQDQAGELCGDPLGQQIAREWYWLRRGLPATHDPWAEIAKLYAEAAALLEAEEVTADAGTT